MHKTHCNLHMKAIYVVVTACVWVRVDRLTAETELNDPLSHLAENHDYCQKMSSLWDGMWQTDWSVHFPITKANSIII